MYYDPGMSLPVVQKELGITISSLLSGKGEAWLLGYDGYKWWLFHRDCPGIRAIWGPNYAEETISCLKSIRNGYEAHLRWTMPDGQEVSDYVEDDQIINFLRSLSEQPHDSSQRH